MTMVSARGKSLCSLLATALVTCAAVVALSPSAADAVTTSCGAGLPNGSGGYRTCTFGDDFNGARLNNGNWQPMTSATTGFTQIGECYVNDQSHIKVASGVLTLTATKSSKPEPCGPSYSTPYQSGLVRTRDRFAQTYGRFEVRAKMPAAGTGLQSALWMWPQDLAYGDRSGEIDIAEWYGVLPDYVSPTLHMHDALGVDHPYNNWCNVANASQAFHTYTVEWQPTSFTFLYDGVPCMTVSSWDPGAPRVAPQPFDQPFFMILQLALGFGPNAVTTETPFPAKFVIDYVRAWR
jgi:beta-glucanase (GH16 family)